MLRSDGGGSTQTWCSTVLPSVRWIKIMKTAGIADTSRNSHDAHDADDGRVDGNEAGLDLLEDDADHRQHHDHHVQLIPPAAAAASTSSTSSSSLVMVWSLYCVYCSHIQLLLRYGRWSDSDGVWLGRRSCDSKGHQFDSRLFRFQLTTLGKLFTHVPRFCIDQKAVIPCGWEGNRQCSTALAMRHRLESRSTYELKD